MVWGSSFSVGASGLTVQGQLAADSADITNKAEAGSVDTQRLVGDRLYAGDFAGSDADARLSNAVSAATDGDGIYLENSVYTADLTTSTQLKIIGSGPTPPQGTVISGSTTWTFNSAVELVSVAAPSNGVTVQINGDQSRVRSFYGFVNTSVNIDAGDIVVTQVRSSEIVLQSNSSRCIVDSCTKSGVFDNGSGNVIGDIA
jgi:hypothetical protein